MTERLASFARRVADDSFFLASALSEFAESEEMDDAALAAYLGGAIGILPAVRLCRRPRAGESFREDVRRIAERFNLREEAVAEAVRRADVIAALQNASSESGLAAARDREDEE
jgi:hypothetical protein